MRMPCPWREYSSNDKRLNHGIQKNTFSCFFLTGIWLCFQDHEFEDGVKNSRLTEKRDNSGVQTIYFSDTSLYKKLEYCPQNGLCLDPLSFSLRADYTAGKWASHWP